MLQDEVLWFAAVWIFGFAAGVSRSIRDCKPFSCTDCIACGLVSGFLAFAVVTLLLPARFRGTAPALGVSSLVGLGGKELTGLIVNTAVKRLGLVDKEDNEQGPTDAS